MNTTRVEKKSIWKTYFPSFVIYEVRMENTIFSSPFFSLYLNYFLDFKYIVVEQNKRP